MHFVSTVLLIDLAVTIFSVHGSLTDDEQNQILLQQLRVAVESNVTKSYETEDAFLVRFLRASEFDVQRASEMILKNLKWRAENNIDGIVHEMNPVDKDLKYTWGTDREGRSTILIRCSELDTRKMIITGNRNSVSRAFLKLMEKLFEVSISSNFSQMVGIVDINGFNVRRHACPECLKMCTDVLQAVEDNYPDFSAAFFMINTPRIFEVILKIIKANMAPRTRKTLHVYGFDQQEWSEALLEWISPEQLYKFFGHHHKLRHQKHISNSASKKIVETSKISDFDGKILWQKRTEATSNIGRIQPYTNVVLILSFMLPKLF